MKHSSKAPYVQQRNNPGKEIIQDSHTKLLTWPNQTYSTRLFSCFLDAIKTFTGIFTNRNLLLATFCSSQSLCLNGSSLKKIVGLVYCHCAMGSAEHLCCWQNSDWNLSERQGWYFQSLSKWKSVHSSIWKLHLGFSVSILVHKSYWSSTFFLKRNLAKISWLAIMLIVHPIFN